MNDERALRNKTIYNITQLVMLFENLTIHLVGVPDLPYHLSHLETNELVQLQSRLFTMISAIRSSNDSEDVDMLSRFIRDRLVALEESPIT